MVMMVIDGMFWPSPGLDGSGQRCAVQRSSGMLVVFKFLDSD